MTAFLRALEGTFVELLDKKKINNSIRIKVDREKLRECYDALWLDHHFVSMTLYSGPFRNNNVKAELKHIKVKKSFYRTHNHYLLYDRGFSGGWMHTGDAHFNIKKRRAQFFNHYKHICNMIGVFMMPHHGSIHNFSPLLLDALPDLRVGYVAAGPNSHGHPYKDVRAAVVGRRLTVFCEVNEKLCKRSAFP